SFLIWALSGLFLGSAGQIGLAEAISKFKPFGENAKIYFRETDPRAIRSGTYSQGSGKIVIYTSGDADYDRLTLLHEIRHRSDADIGYTPLAQKEISARVAEYLAFFSETPDLPDIDAKEIPYHATAPYDINYVTNAAFDKKLAETAILGALKDWEESKSFYEVVIKTLSLTDTVAAKLSKERLGDSFTFTINGEKTNLYAMAGEEVRKQVRDSINEFNIFIKTKDRLD
ncbi:MAG: hypothetical protein LBL21_03820, partial [Rickettsiales bacterium]|nr:hypothetical protein [Rickettsiales bacterium]